MFNNLNNGFCLSQCTTVDASCHFKSTALCKEDANANVPLGKSCERYWACQGGYPRLQRCPATLVFDKQSRRCVNPPTVDCDVPSTTPAPEEEIGTGPIRRPQNTRRRPQAQQASPVQGGQFIETGPRNQQPIQQGGQFLDGPPPPPRGGNFRPPPISGAIPLN